MRNVLDESKQMNWRSIKTAQDACQLIDVGLMLTWKDMRAVRGVLPVEEQQAVVRHIAGRFCERLNMRLSGEILIETLLIWLANASSDELLHTFLQQFFQEPGFDEASWSLVEVALTTEVSDYDHTQEIYSMAVALSSHLGLYLQEFERVYPGEFKNIDGVLDYIATFLLSVSNTNSNSIRLTLLHYFGATEKGKTPKQYLDRLLSRFGYTILEQLFYLLFKKKSEAVALEYILENLPYILEMDDRNQHIVHETFKFYLLKEPDRFALFIQIFSDHLMKSDESEMASVAFLKHLGVLLQVVSYVNHKHLGRELLRGIMRFEGLAYRDQLLAQLSQDPNIRKSFRELLKQLQTADEAEGTIDSATHFKSSKRGRKPCFSRIDGMGIIQQVTYLGQFEIARAS